MLRYPPVSGGEVTALAHCFLALDWGLPLIWSPRGPGLLRHIQAHELNHSAPGSSYTPGSSAGGERLLLTGGLGGAGLGRAGPRPIALTRVSPSSSSAAGHCIHFCFSKYCNLIIEIFGGPLYVAPNASLGLVLHRQALFTGFSTGSSLLHL